MEIYNTTWWGNAIDTAITAGTEPDFFGSQMKMLTSQQPELVVNGDFATDSDWLLSSQTTISGGSARILSSDGSFQYLGQVDILTIGKKYKITFDIVQILQGSLKVGTGNGQSNIAVVSTEGFNTFYFTATGDDIFFSRIGVTDITIDNVSITLARAEEVEAVKCLADWIHTTALQDLNN